MRSMSCAARNPGSGYDTKHVQWACQASLALEFKVESAEVVCEKTRSIRRSVNSAGQLNAKQRLIREHRIWENDEAIVPINEPSGL